MSQPAYTQLLREACHEGDPPADAIVAAIQAGGLGWPEVRAALATAAADPHEHPLLTALLDPVRAVPEGVDLDVVDVGAVATWRVGAFPLFLAMTYGSLAFGYQSPRLARPLALTGRLEQMAGRRLGETSRWFVAVTTPGGLRPGAEGWRLSLHVRLVHALVRDHLLRSEGWDAEAWGVPISAADGCLTAIGGFHVAPLHALQDLGVRVSPQEREALCHLWSWVARLMGVPAELLPVDAAEAATHVELALELDAEQEAALGDRGRGGPDDGARLLDALLHHGLPLERAVPGVALGPVRAVAAQLTGGLARRWMGADAAHRLRAPGGAVAPFVPLLRPWTVARDLVVATGLLGSHDAVAARELALVRWTLQLTRAPDVPLQPESAAEHPVVPASGPRPTAAAR